MKYFYLVAVLFIFSSQVYSFENINIPLEQSSNTQSQYYLSNEDFEFLEKKIFKKTYKTDSSKNRLARLEKELFGMEQTGDVEERYENVLTASEYYEDTIKRKESSYQKENEPKYYTYEYSPKDYPQNTKNNNQNNLYDNNKDYYSYSQPKPQKPSKVKQFLSDIVETFAAGAATGITPPIYYSDLDSLGGSSFYGFPQITQFPSYVNIPNPRYYYPPVSRASYSPANRNYYYPRHFPPPPPSGNRYYPRRNNYSYNPYGTGTGTYNSGTRVRIID